tara:strand:+ start:4639 stop:5037 length:399 start_codon:yes stop_codon:yes gene_type:complete
MRNKLTAKQQRFIEEYCVDFNATQAAIRAGYSKHTAAAIGPENLEKPLIASAIEKYKQSLSETTNLTITDLDDNILWMAREARRRGNFQALGKALDLYGKRLMAYTDKQVHVEEESYETLLERLKGDSENDG